MPRRVRPRFPKKWGVPNDPKKWITWAHASQKLENETEYWVATSSLKGEPHATPVWGIWKDEKFYFETDPGSVKGLNLKSNPRIVVHVQDGLDTVIVKGTADREENPKKLSTLRSDYFRKYQYRPDWSDSSAQMVFRVSPSVVHAWKAPKMHQSLVKFVF